MNELTDRAVPLRVTTREACRLARVSRATLFRRIAQGRLPGPVDRGRELLFCRRSLISALSSPPTGTDPATEDAAAALDALLSRRRNAARHSD